MNEPNLLDYLKSVLRGKPLELPPEDGIETSPDELALAVIPEPVPESEPTPLPKPVVGVARPAAPEPETLPPPIESAFPGPVSIPWRSGLALLVALFAQISLDSVDRTWQMGMVLYIIAAALLVWAVRVGEWRVPNLPQPEIIPDAWGVKRLGVYFGGPLLLLTFFFFGGNRFTDFNLLLWVLTTFYLLWAFWYVPDGETKGLARIRAGVANVWRSISTFQVRPWTLLLIGVFGIILFFHFYRFESVPSDMISDHAEKLLDTQDVLDGQQSIFFPRNTGREAVQFYLIAAISKWFGTGVSFTSMKFSSTIGFLLTLPFIYLLGKEFGNRRIGLFAIFFAGISYWSNMFARFGLRFFLYAWWTAPTMYFFVRGLRRQSRNDMILSGIALGIGLQGYTPMRIVPFLLVIGLGLYLLHHRQTKQTIPGFSLLVLFSVIGALPLLRYSLENPDAVAYRAFSRLSGSEQAIVDPLWLIFFKNTWNAMVMFFWSNGNVWVHSIPLRPALDVVSAALFFLGFVLVIVRYVRQRTWQDLFLVVSIPMLLMPSILSLAFPAENPALNRTTAVIIPVFVMVGIALDSLMTTLVRAFNRPWGRQLTIGLVLFLGYWSASQNFDLVFNQYAPQFENGAWNTSEMGEVIRFYADGIGNKDSAWVVGYPHWVDTRLVGINAGFPRKDYAIWPDQFPLTVDTPAPKLFLVNLNDQPALDQLRVLYPNGTLRLYESDVETKDFWMYLVLDDVTAFVPVVEPAQGDVGIPYP